LKHIKDLQKLLTNDEAKLDLGYYLNKDRSVELLEVSIIAPEVHMVEQSLGMGKVVDSNSTRGTNLKKEQNGQGRI
jgi:hypothetical protein